MNIEKMREEFHLSFGAEYSNSTNRDMTTKQYNDPVTKMAWWAWQASREALVIELPNFDQDKYWSKPEWLIEEFSKDCKLAIESAGVKCEVKS